MDLPLSTIQNTFSDKFYDIPKLNANVSYICLETKCGYQVIGGLEISMLGGYYTGALICPGCGATLWKVIK